MRRVHDESCNMNLWEKAAAISLKSFGLAYGLRGGGSVSFCVDNAIGNTIVFITPSANVFLEKWLCCWNLLPLIE